MTLVYVNVLPHILNTNCLSLVNMCHICKTPGLMGACVSSGNRMLCYRHLRKKHRFVRRIYFAQLTLHHINVICGIPFKTCSNGIFIHNWFVRTMSKISYIA